MAMRWYVVHAYSGFEKSVQRALQEKINRGNLQDKFGQILVPVEEVVEVKAVIKALPSANFSLATCWWKWKCPMKPGTW